MATVCEYCNDPIPLLERGEICIGKTLPFLSCDQEPMNYNTTVKLFPNEFH